MRFGKESLKDFQTAISKEYLLTNGLGGFCSSTICGCNRRKYNALLIASLNPPVDRVLLLSKLDETIFIDNKKYNLFTNQTEKNKIESGLKYLSSFEYNYFPEFNYDVKGVLIQKKITMIYGKNTTVVNYKVRNNNKPVKIKIDVLINNRDHHSNTKKGDFCCRQETNINGAAIGFNINDTKLYIQSDKAKYEEENIWHKGLYLKEEEERGFEPVDVNYISGCFYINLQPEECAEFSIIASAEPIVNTDGEKYFTAEQNRKDKLINKLPVKDDITKKLALTCDQFIVKRKSTNTSTVIAGYPWFTDWGRDTMISLPGLTLVTGRFEDAKELLITFAKYIKNGLVPNMFPDTGVEPVYNTVDGSLWYFIAVYKYLQYTKDYEFIEKEIFPRLTSMIEYHINGTDFKIKMDPKDCLLSAGDSSLQLTWMDVKIGDKTITPRQGKAVEINALWYNAVCIYAQLCRKFNKGYSKYEQLSRKIKKSFLDKFWNEEKNYLYDYIDGDCLNDQIRPNAVIALSLPFEIAEKGMAVKVLETAFEKLYTPYGLRSLCKEDKEYIGIYKGDYISRDSAYHQGTVWTWLMGPFITAVNKYYHDKQLTKNLFYTFYDHIYDCCVGNVSEVLDGDDPYTPRACSAQAWGAAEMLRSYVEDVVRS